MSEPAPDKPPEMHCVCGLPKPQGNDTRDRLLMRLETIKQERRALTLRMADLTAEAEVIHRRLATLSAFAHKSH